MLTHPHHKLVERLGGATRLAATINTLEGREAVGRDPVQKWKRNGVPWEWRARVAQLLVAAGLDVPNDFLPPGVHVAALSVVDPDAAPVDATGHSTSAPAHTPETTGPQRTV